MTSLTLQYAAQNEQKRSNLANEALKHAANVETNRHNLATEKFSYDQLFENARQFDAQLAQKQFEFTQSHALSVAVAAENARHNAATESISAYSAQASMLNAQARMLGAQASMFGAEVNFFRAKEDSRHNKASELSTWTSVNNARLQQVENKDLRDRELKQAGIKLQLDAINAQTNAARVNESVRAAGTAGVANFLIKALDVGARAFFR